MRRAPSLVAIAGLVVTLSAAPVAAQSPGASSGPSASPPAVVPMCSDLPENPTPPDRFRDAPIYISNEQPIEALHRWARKQPGFQEIWIDRDHLGWVVIAFSHDADARQVALERRFPGVGIAAIDVDWTTKQLDALQERASVMDGLVVGTATDIKRGVVILMIGVLDEEKVAEVRREFAGARVCIDGIDPATLPVPGPQPQAGDGWRLLGDAKVGEPYRTGIAADGPSFKALWKQAGMPGSPPAVDFEQQVAIWFGAVYGSSCPAIRLDDVVADTAGAFIHAEIVQTDAVIVCTLDARGHSYLIALDRDRLPAPPFRIQLYPDDPPMGATEGITVVEADLRVPGSVPGRGEVHPMKATQGRRLVRSGDYLEPGEPDHYALDARCGVEWLGELDRVWWRTQVPPGSSTWIPDAWQPAVGADGMLQVTVLLRTADDPANPDGRPRAEVTRNDETVVYHATAEVPPACE